MRLRDDTILTIEIPLVEWNRIAHLYRKVQDVTTRRYEAMEQDRFDKAGDLLNQIDQLNADIVASMSEAFITQET